MFESPEKVQNKNICTINKAQTIFLLPKCTQGLKFEYMQQFS